MTTVTALPPASNPAKRSRTKNSPATRELLGRIRKAWRVFFWVPDLARTVRLTKAEARKLAKESAERLQLMAVGAGPNLWLEPCPF